MSEQAREPRARLLAIERIEEKAAALIRPTALDFYQVGAEALHGFELEHARLIRRLLENTDRAYAAAARLTVLTKHPSDDRHARYDDRIHKDRGARS